MALPHCQATAQQERGRMAAAPKRAQDELVKTWQVVFCVEKTRCVRKCEMSKMTWQACFSDDFLANDSTNLLTLEGAIKQWYNQRTPTSDNITKELIFCRIVLLCFVHGLFVLLQEQKPSYHRNQSALICPWAKICHGFWAVWGWLSSVIRQEYWQFTC